MADFLEESVRRIVTEDISVAKQAYAPLLEEASKVYAENKGCSLPTNIQDTMIKNFSVTKSIFEDAYPGLKNRTPKEYYKETTVPSNINSFINYGFDIISAMNVSNVIDEFTSIQGMDKLIGQVFFLDYVIGTSKGAKRQGQDYLSSLYGPQTSEAFSDERVLSEPFAVGDGSDLSFTGTMEWLPVKTIPTAGLSYPMTIYYTIGGTAYEATVNAAGAITGTYVDGTSNMNYTTGVLTFTTTGGHAVDNLAAITVDYEYNSTDNAVLAYGGRGYPEVDVKLTSITMEAKRRVLKQKWLLDSSLILQKHHGLSFESDLLETVVGGAMNEIALELANDLYRKANAASEITFHTTPAATNIPQIVHYQNMLNTIVEGDTNIESAVRKIRASFIIGGSNFMKVAKVLPADMFKPTTFADSVPVGMHVAGVLNNQYKVIQNFDFPVDRVLIGAKGNKFYETGSVYAPFIPLMMSNLIPTENLVMTKTLLTYYGWKVIQPKMYQKMSVVA